MRFFIKGVILRLFLTPYLLLFRMLEIFSIVKLIFLSNLILSFLYKPFLKLKSRDAAFDNIIVVFSLILYKYYYFTIHIAEYLIVTHVGYYCYQKGRS